MNKFPKSETNPTLIQNKFKELQNQYTDFIPIYTDASKSTEGVGAAVLFNGTFHKFKLPKYSSNFTAELYAIYQAVVLIENSPYSKFSIFTDSRSSIETVEQLY